MVLMPSTVAWVMFSVALLFSLLAGGGLLPLFNVQIEPRFYVGLILFQIFFG